MVEFGMIWGAPILGTPHIMYVGKWPNLKLGVFSQFHSGMKKRQPGAPGTNWTAAGASWQRSRNSSEKAGKQALYSMSG